MRAKAKKCPPVVPEYFHGSLHIQTELPPKNQLPKIPVLPLPLTFWKQAEHLKLYRTVSEQTSLKKQDGIYHPDMQSRMVPNKTAVDCPFSQQNHFAPQTDVVHKAGCCAAIFSFRFAFHSGWKDNTCCFQTPSHDIPYCCHKKEHR